MLAVGTKPVPRKGSRVRNIGVLPHHDTVRDWLDRASRR
jgi:hypothetical protein